MLGAFADKNVNLGMWILLDIDGVMVPANSWKKPEFHEDGFPLLSEKATRALQKIIAETNAKILLTTSHKEKYSLPQWRGIFKSRGVNVHGINRLTKTEPNLNRAAEILNWYKTKHKAGEHFVMIDDDKLLNGLPYHIKENLVLISSSIGLTDELADNAISILKHGKLVLHRNFAFAITNNVKLCRRWLQGQLSFKI